MKKPPYQILQFIKTTVGYYFLKMYFCIPKIGSEQL